MRLEQMSKLSEHAAHAGERVPRRPDQLLDVTVHPRLAHILKEGAAACVCLCVLLVSPKDRVSVR